MRYLSGVFDALAVLALVALVLVACDKDRPRRDRDYDEPRAEEPRAPGTFRVVNIPACGEGKAGYVTIRWPAPMTGSTMRIEYTVTASDGALIIGNEERDRLEPGRMALFFQRDGDDFGYTKYNAGYRQWSLARDFLTPGSHVFEVALTHDKWTTIGGEHGFDAARNDVENVGFTLSGAQSAGHGVCMASGTASITVTSFTIN